MQRKPFAACVTEGRLGRVSSPCEKAIKSGLELCSHTKFKERGELEANYGVRMGERVASQVGISPPQPSTWLSQIRGFISYIRGLVAFYCCIPFSIVVLPRGPVFDPGQMSPATIVRVLFPFPAWSDDGLICDRCEYSSVIKSSGMEGPYPGIWWKPGWFLFSCRCRSIPGNVSLLTKNGLCTTLL